MRRLEHLRRLGHRVPYRITAKEVTAADADANGLRYFLPAPYLVIEQTADAKWDARMELGVDRSREFYIQPQAVFAKGNAVISFNDDGTLESFKLDADSTAVPSSVVAAAKDVELKRLELERAALDAAEKKKDEKGGAGAALLNIKGKRAFAVYRVKGEQVVGVPAQPATSVVEGYVSVDAAGGVRDPDAISTDPPALTARPSADGSKLVIKLADRNLTEADKAKLHFFTSDDGRTEKQISATKLILQNGVIQVDRAETQDVKRVTLAQ